MQGIDAEAVGVVQPALPSADLAGFAGADQACGAPPSPHSPGAEHDGETADADFSADSHIADPAGLEAYFAEHLAGGRSSLPPLLIPPPLPQQLRLPPQPTTPAKRKRGSRDSSATPPPLGNLTNANAAAATSGATAVRACGVALPAPPRAAAGAPSFMDVVQAALVSGWA